MSQTIAADEFEAKCLQILDEVQEEHKEVIITKRGQPVARLVPVEGTVEEIQRPRPWGVLKGTSVVLGDIIGPSSDSDEPGCD